MLKNETAAGSIALKNKQQLLAAAGGVDMVVIAGSIFTEGNCSSGERPCPRDQSSAADKW